MADAATGKRKPTAAGATGAPRSSGRQPRRRGRAKRVLFGGLIAIVALALIGTISGIIFYQRQTLPDPNAAFTTNTTYVYYRDGKTPIGSFAVQNREALHYTDIPQSIKDAVVAAENQSFWTDSGISIRGIVRSAWSILRGGDVQGGSTITQQYIKILYLTSDRTVTRKLRELVLAAKMSKTVAKRTILTGYLNTIYFGRGAYGIQAASRAYFGVDASQLKLSQAAVLASILNNPSLYDPSDANGKVRLLARYQYVLDSMLKMGTINQAQHDSIYNQLPTFPDIPESSRYGGTKGYLLHMVETELAADGFTSAQIQGGGLRVTTTFDSGMEAAAVATGQKYRALVGANAGKNGASQIHPAIASVQVGTGEVLAIYGGDDYVTNSRNWATTDRPAASTFKAYALVAGLRNGFSLRSQLNGDTFTPPGDSVSIRNEFSTQYGTVSLQKATADSINTAFVDMVTQIPDGPNQVIQAAEDAGVPKGAGWDVTDRIPLGIAEVSPLSNAGGYATFANGGVAVKNHVIKQVTDAAGKVLFTGKTTGTQTVDPSICRDVTYALESVVQQGTGGQVANLGYDIAGKTGTAGVEQNGKNVIVSAWFVAYTKQISTAVMYVAGDGGNSALDPFKRSYDSTFFGGTYPAMTWASYMTTALNGLPNEPFDSAAWVNSTAWAPATQSPGSLSSTPASNGALPSSSAGTSKASSGAKPTTRSSGHATGTARSTSRSTKTSAGG